jgi:hypothetical protein
MATVTDILVTKFVMDGADNAERTFQRLGRAGDDVEKRLEVMRETAANVMTGIGTGVALEFGRSLKKGMDAIEADNLVQLTFGENLPEIEEWSKKLRQDLKLNEYELRRNAAMFGSLFKGAGANESQVMDMSKNITTLSRDLASLFNTSNQDAVDSLRSALVGESEPIRKYNVLLNEAAVNNYAYAKGIARAGSELNEQQKVLARYGLILEQTKMAQGDLERTKDSPANLARAAVEELGNLETDFGKTQEKLMQTVLKGVHGVLPVVESVVNMFSRLPQPVQALAIGGAITAGPLMKVTGALNEYRNAANLAKIAKQGLKAATVADDAAEAAKAVTATKEAAAIGNVGKMAGETATKVGLLGRTTGFFATKAFGLSGAGALALGVGAVAATAYAAYDINESRKDMGLADDDYAKKRGPRGEWELDRAAMWSEKWDAATGKTAQSEETDRRIAFEKQRMLNRRHARGQAGVEDNGVPYATTYAAAPPPPAVYAQMQRRQQARVSVNVDVPYTGGDFLADDRDATRLAGA